MKNFDVIDFGWGALAVVAAKLLWDRRAPALHIPSDGARSAAATITSVANASGCNRIAAEYVQTFQAAMNPWLAGVYPLLRTDGVLDTDTAQWVDDVNSFYNGMHGQFPCVRGGT